MYPTQAGSGWTKSGLHPLKPYMPEISRPRLILRKPIQTLNATPWQGHSSSLRLPEGACVDSGNLSSRY
jgi:hypothetical protein